MFDKRCDKISKFVDYYTITPIDGQMDFMTNKGLYAEAKYGT